MITEKEKRLEAFEKMLAKMKQDYEDADKKMKTLKSEGKEKTATYRQLMGNKLQYQNMLCIYKAYDLMN